jgi:hypothetical protein
MVRTSLEDGGRIFHETLVTAYETESCPNPEDRNRSVTNRDVRSDVKLSHVSLVVSRAVRAHLR